MQQASWGWAMYIYIYMYMHAYVYVYAHAHTDTHTYLHVYCVYEYRYTHAQTCSECLRVERARYTQLATILIQKCKNTYMHSYLCIHTWYETFTCTTWHICICTMWPILTRSWHKVEHIYTCQMCEMTHSYAWHGTVWHDALIRVTWHIRMCDMNPTHSTSGDTTGPCTFIFVLWRTRMCDMTHSYMCDMTHSYTCDMNHIHLTLIYDRRSSYMFKCVVWRIHICDMTHSHAWHDAYSLGVEIGQHTVIHVRICDVTHS